MTQGEALKLVPGDKIKVISRETYFPGIPSHGQGPFAVGEVHTVSGVRTDAHHGVVVLRKYSTGLAAKEYPGWYCGDTTRWLAFDAIAVERVVP